MLVIIPDVGCIKDFFPHLWNHTSFHWLLFPRLVIERSAEPFRDILHLLTEMAVHRCQLSEHVRFFMWILNKYCVKYVLQFQILICYHETVLFALYQLPCSLDISIRIGLWKNHMGWPLEWAIMRHPTKVLILQCSKSLINHFNG